MTRITETNFSKILEPILRPGWVAMLERDRVRIKKFLKEKGFSKKRIDAYFKMYGVDPKNKK